MGNPYTHDDGTPLVCERGAAGVKPCIAKQEVEHLYDAAHPQALHRLEHTSPYGSQSSYNLPDVDSRNLPPPIEEMASQLCKEFPETGASDVQQVTRAYHGGPSANLINSPIMFGVILSGRVHPYPIKEWQKVAPEWRRGLMHEGESAIRSLHSDMDNITDYTTMNDNYFFVSRTSAAFASVKSWFADESKKLPPLPKMDDYNALLHRVADAYNTVLNSDPIEYQDLYESAIEYMKVRASQRYLNERFKGHRDGLIAGAENAVIGLQITESTAFTVLDMAARAKAKIEFPGNPLAEAGYRMAVASLHAATKGGVAYAYDRDGRKAVKELGTQLGADVPGIFADAVVKILGKRFTIFKDEDGRLPKAVSGMVKILIQTVFEIIDFEVFVMWHTPEAEKEKKSEEFRSEKQFGVMRDAIAAVIGVLFNTGPESPRAKVVAEKIATECFKNISDDLRKAKVAAKAENKTMTEEFLQELPWTIVRIITGVAAGLSDRKLDSMAKADHAAAAARADAAKTASAPPADDAAAGAGGASGSAADGAGAAPGAAPKAPPSPKAPATTPPLPHEKEYRPAMGVKRKAASVNKLTSEKVKAVKKVAVVDRTPLTKPFELESPPRPAVAKIIAQIDAIDIAADVQGKKALFYSGQNGKNQEKAKAQYATDPDRYIMIDETWVGKFLTSKGLYEPGNADGLSKAEADQVWAYASKKYAGVLSGNVIGFVEKADVNRVWVQIEWHALGANKNVTGVFTDETDLQFGKRFDFDSKAQFFSGWYSTEEEEAVAKKNAAQAP